MDEIVIRLARAIASWPRLWILSYLAQHGEVTPTRLASKLRMPLNTLSAHLRILSSTGLILGRRSGGQCGYALISPYREQTLSGDMSRWLKGLLAEKATKEGHSGLLEVRNRSARAAHPSLHVTLFEAATGFTDLRRLQILRYLQSHPDVDRAHLVKELRMSPQAVGRHTAKLQRRGFITVQSKPDGRVCCRLASEYKTPVHRRMLQIVQKTWAQG
ncbi:MAG: helix-turn-helix domain-containing protein [Planctomycetes bacterium]|nr:helix-turn-helix domain-containing protein [Planctomycetota bacterium]MBM4085994.1 helix-turn-helix domain-containing protein [Planctomycetota bacterium]